MKPYFLPTTHNRLLTVRSQFLQNIVAILFTNFFDNVNQFKYLLWVNGAKKLRKSETQ